MKWFRAMLVLLLAACTAAPARAQQEQIEDTTPLEALTAAMVGACRHSEAQFARYLTERNAEEFRRLPPSYRRELMKRFLLLEEPGRPLLSTDARGNKIVRCDTPSYTAELRLGRERIEENLAFVPLDTGSRQTEIGLVREGGSWRIVSVGILLINLSELSKQWAAQEMEQKEQAAITVLRQLAEAIERYRRAFGVLPETLAQLGPATGGISPDAASLVDAELAAGSKAGYRFRYRIFPAGQDQSEARFEIAAVPAEYGRTGKRSFFLDTTGRLRGGDKQGAVATAFDPPIAPANPSNPRP
ncbi:MAG TPA: hypothetical protein VGA40_01915 [Candidatus Acidoferrales bacterium]